MPQQLRIILAGGGTGGHVIPALEIARELRARYNAEIHFIGTQRGLETRLVPEAGFTISYVQVGMLANVSLKTRLKTLSDLPRAVFTCSHIFSEFKPNLVIGVGGYASGPAMIAAIMRRIPTLALETNAIPGMVNRVVGRFVSGAAISFEGTRRYFHNAHVTGRPVRKELFDIRPKASSPPRLLVMGGSQGALSLNTVMPHIATQLMEAVPGLTIVHQAGARHLEATQAAYQAVGVDAARYTVVAFLDVPAELYAADLVLCRSGGTVEELCAAGRPSVLIPFPQAADDHQRKNAEAMEAGGAALMLLEKDMTEEKLFETLRDLLLDVARLEQMSVAARRMAHPLALQQIGELAAALARR